MIAIIIENRVWRACLCAALAGTVWAGRLEAGERAPPVTLPGIDGGEVRFEPKTKEAAGGEPTAVVVAFVRPGQRQSTDALRDLRAWREKHAEFAPRVRLIAIASGTLSEDEVRQLRDRLPAAASITAALDPDKKAFKDFGVVALPTTFVLDATGLVIETLPGRSKGSPKKLAAGLRQALGLSPEEAAAPAAQSNEEKKVARLRKLAADLRSRRRYEDAAAQIAQAAELLPEDLSLQIELGDLRLLLEDGEGAGKAYARVLELDPKSRAGRAGAAKALALGDDLDAAEAALNEALARPPQESALFYYLGRVLERAGRHAEAVKAYRRAYEQLRDGR